MSAHGLMTFEAPPSRLVGEAMQVDLRPCRVPNGPPGSPRREQGSKLASGAAKHFGARWPSVILAVQSRSGDAGAIVPRGNPAFARSIVLDSSDSQGRRCDPGSRRARKPRNSKHMCQFRPMVDSMEHGSSRAASARIAYDTMNSAGTPDVLHGIRANDSPAWWCGLRTDRAHRGGHRTFLASARAR